MGHYKTIYVKKYHLSTIKPSKRFYEELKGIHPTDYPSYITSGFYEDEKDFHSYYSMNDMKKRYKCHKLFTTMKKRIWIK